MYHSFLIHSSPALEIYHRDMGKDWGSKTETEEAKQQCDLRHSCAETSLSQMLHGGSR